MTTSKEKFKLIPAVSLMILKDNKILLGRRYNTGWADGYYDIPGGHVDGNETMKQAVLREAVEEVGIETSEENLNFVHFIHRRADTGVERIDLFFKTNVWHGEPRITEPDKCDALDWFDLNNLPENMVPKARQAIEKMIAGESYSEFGW